LTFNYPRTLDLDFLWKLSCQNFLEPSMEAALSEFFAKHPALSSEHLYSLIGQRATSVTHARSLWEDIRKGIPAYTIEERETLPGGSDDRFQQVDAFLFPLVQFERSLPMDLSESRSLTRSEYDVLINDIGENDFEQFALELEFPARVAALKSDSPIPVSPYVGLVRGLSSRVFVVLPVVRKEWRVNVLFLVDTGSPYTYIREQTMAMLGLDDNIPQALQVKIGIYDMGVGLSRGHFYNVDLLGGDFLRLARAVLNVDYFTNTCTLTAQ
jgi:hypothetical protein